MSNCGNANIIINWRQFYVILCVKTFSWKLLTEIFSHCDFEQKNTKGVTTKCLINAVITVNASFQKNWCWQSDRHCRDTEVLLLCNQKSVLMRWAKPSIRNRSLNKRLKLFAQPVHCVWSCAFIVQTTHISTIVLWIIQFTYCQGTMKT